MTQKRPSNESTTARLLRLLMCEMPPYHEPSMRVLVLCPSERVTEQSTGREGQMCSLPGPNVAHVPGRLTALLALLQRIVVASISVNSGLWLLLWTLCKRPKS